MIYKYLPSPSKMLPKVYFSKTGRQLEYGPDSSVIKAYEEKKNGNALYYKDDFGTEKQYISSLIEYFNRQFPNTGIERLENEKRNLDDGIRYAG